MVCGLHHFIVFGSLFAIRQMNLAAPLQHGRLLESIICESRDQDIELERFVREAVVLRTMMGVPSRLSQFVAG